MLLRAERLVNLNLSVTTWAVAPQSTNSELDWVADTSRLSVLTLNANCSSFVVLATWALSWLALLALPLLQQWLSVWLVLGQKLHHSFGLLSQTRAIWPTCLYLTDTVTTIVTSSVIRFNIFVFIFYYRIVVTGYIYGTLRSSTLRNAALNFVNEYCLRLCVITTTKGLNDSWSPFRTIAINKPSDTLTNVRNVCCFHIFTYLRTCSVLTVVSVTRNSTLLRISILHFAIFKKMSSGVIKS